MILMLDQLVDRVGFLCSVACDRVAACETIEDRFQSMRAASFLDNMLATLAAMQTEAHEMMPKLIDIMPEINEYAREAATEMLGHVGELPDGYSASVVGPTDTDPVSVAVTGPDPEGLEFGDASKPGAYPLLGALWAMPPGME